MKDFLGFLLGVFLGLIGLFGISHALKAYSASAKPSKLLYQVPDTSLVLDAKDTQKIKEGYGNSKYSGNSYHSYKTSGSSHKSSSSGSWVKGSYDRRGHYRKAHYRKKYSTSPHAFKNRMRSRVYYHTRGKYRRH